MINQGYKETEHGILRPAELTRVFTTDDHYIHVSQGGDDLVMIAPSQVKDLIRAIVVAKRYLEERDELH